MSAILIIINDGHINTNNLIYLNKYIYNNKSTFYRSINSIYSINCSNTILIFYILMNCIPNLSNLYWGILVIFSYFVSLTPNQTINILSIILILSSTYIILLSIITINNIKPKFSPLYIIQSNSFYLKSNSSILVLLATILLITIIIVVKLTINFKGPLRPFNTK